MQIKVSIFLLLFLAFGQIFGQQVKIMKLVLPLDSLSKSPSDTIYPVKNSVNLTYQRNSLFIYFNSIDKTAELAFQLSKITPDSIRTLDTCIFLTNLPPGDHQFTVWDSKKPKSSKAHLTIIVESPIWLHWWFLPLLFLYGLLLMGLILYLVYRYRLRQLLHLQSIRGNIARDLHDDMGSYLSSISVLSQSVMNLSEKDPQKANLLINKIGETARQVMDSMGDIIWSVNPDNDSIGQITVRMRDVGADLLEGQDVKFKLDIDDALLQSHLPLEQRRDFFLIYKEALTNIAKYAQANHVWVRLNQKDSALLLTIQDDGVGFNPDQPIGQNPLGGNGLKNMQSRANKMGAAFTIISASGQGTTLSLQISLV